MAYTEKELEDQLREAGNRLLKPPSALDELHLLLDEVENCLSRVEQSPSASMVRALHPSTQALIAKELLRHEDMDVKVAVASCISEITRITAPEAPYDDGLMKEIFQMIVAAFEGLFDMSSPSYTKRVSILETVAKVRSCVVMLDLECDDLILEMFDHFLKGIRENHPDNIFSSMETIMTLVLEESEDISSELLHCLLSCARKENQDILPIARRLGEKVIRNCAAKIKPYLLQEVESSRIALDDYTKIITSIYQDTFYARAQESLDASGPQSVEENKLSERMGSEEPPQGANGEDHEVACPGEDHKLDKPARVLMSNGTSQEADGNSGDPVSPQKKLQSETTSTMAEGKSDHMDSPKVTKLESFQDLPGKKLKAQENSSITHSADTSDHSGLESKKEPVELTSRKRGLNKDVDSSISNDPSTKEASVLLEGDNKTGFLSPTVSHTEAVGVASPVRNQSVSDTARRRRGRTTSKKSEGASAEVDVQVSPRGQMETVSSEHVVDETCQSLDNKLNKDSEENSDMDVKVRKRATKKGGARSSSVEEKRPIADNISKKEPDGVSDSEVKRRSSKMLQGEDATEGESAEKQHGEQPKHKKGASKSEQGTPKQLGKKKDSSLKSAAKTSKKDEIHVDETPKMEAKRKRSTTEKASGEDFGEEIIGRKIKVWWPRDKTFYNGKVVSFDPARKKHEIYYDDGDMENLVLKKQRFNFIEDGSDEEKPSEVASTDASDLVPKKKMRTSSDFSMKRAKTDSIPRRDEGISVEKSKGEGSKSVSKSDYGASKFKSKLNSNAVKLGSNSKEGTNKTGSKSQDKVVSKSKDASPKTAGKPRDETPKASSKSMDDNTRTSSKGNGSTARTPKLKEGKDSVKGQTASMAEVDGDTKSGKMVQKSEASSGKRAANDSKGKSAKKHVHESETKSAKKAAHETGTKSGKKAVNEGATMGTKKTTGEIESKGGKKTAGASESKVRKKIGVETESKAGRKYAEESDSKGGKKPADDCVSKGGKNSAEESELTGGKKSAEESEHKGVKKSAQKSELNRGKRIAQESERTTSGKKRKGK